MSWKWLLVFPLAALLTGTPVKAPVLQAPIPEINDPICDYDSAEANYLMAYAYAREAPSRSRGLLSQAEDERALCDTDTSALRARISELKGRLR